MLYFGWSPLVQVPVPILWWLYRAHQLQLVSPSLSCSIVFFFSVLYQGLSTYLSSCFLSVLPSGQPERQSPLFGRFFSWLTITRSGRLDENRWSVCILKFQNILCISFSRTDSGLWVYRLFLWSNSNFQHYHYYYYYYYWIRVAIKMYEKYFYEQSLHETKFDFYH